MQQIEAIEIEVICFYPEEFRKKIDEEKYKSKGTCEVLARLNGIEIEIKNITYRIEREGKIILKPPFRIHSNKKAGIKPKLVPSIVFRDPVVWKLIEGKIKEEIPRMKEVGVSGDSRQLDFWDDFLLL